MTKKYCVSYTSAKRRCANLKINGTICSPNSIIHQFVGHVLNYHFSRTAHRLFFESGSKHFLLLCCNKAPKNSSVSLHNDIVSKMCTSVCIRYTSGTVFIGHPEHPVVKVIKLKIFSRLAKVLAEI